MKRSAHSYLRVVDVEHAISDANISSTISAAVAAPAYIHLAAHKLYAPDEHYIDLDSAARSQLAEEADSSLILESKRD